MYTSLRPIGAIFALVGVVLAMIGAATYVLHFGRADVFFTDSSCGPTVSLGDGASTSRCRWWYAKLAGMRYHDDSDRHTSGWHYTLVLKRETLPNDFVPLRRQQGEALYRAFLQGERDVRVQVYGAYIVRVSTAEGIFKTSRFPATPAEKSTAVAIGGSILTFFGFGMMFAHAQTRRFRLTIS